MKENQRKVGEQQDTAENQQNMQREHARKQRKATTFAGRKPTIPFQTTNAVTSKSGIGWLEREETRILIKA